ncbi:two-component system, OmpR family, sensor histidine kinase VanS [Lentzea californiensis]|nr:two-component system, OmpR family, sensor histidine kinase VanS [Lentzea californiensis]
MCPSIASPGNRNGDISRRRDIEEIQDVVDEKSRHQKAAASAIALFAIGMLIAGYGADQTASTSSASGKNTAAALEVQEETRAAKTIAGIRTAGALQATYDRKTARYSAANASHELRTQLAITQTLLDVARKDRDADELVDRLHFVNARAIDLTEALLLLSRADQRTFTCDRVDLSLLAEEAVETLLPLADKHGVAVETSGDIAFAAGSPALLLQIATNLVHNAIVHNDRGTVWISTVVGPAFVTLTVENTGERLTQRLVSTLTEPFQRGTERVRRDQAGVGLGLAIVKSITHAHDGTLTLTPRAEGGLRVTVRLPAAP